MTRADARGRKPARERHHGDEDLALRSRRRMRTTASTSRPTQMKTAIEPFEKIRKAVGDRMEIMVEFHSLWNLPTAKKIARALEPYQPTWYEDPIRMNSPQALAEYARVDRCLGLRQRDARHPLPLQGHARPRRHPRRDGGPCWTGGLTEGRKIAAMAETYHRPFAPHDCIGPVGLHRRHPRLLQPAQHADPGERARLLYRLVQRARHRRCR